MTQDKLNYLLVLAEEQNVTRAAHRLYITQPTLTGFLNRLEQDVGFRIFDRQSSPVTLTSSGKRYIEGMQKLLREEHELKEKLRCEAQSRIQFRIGIGQIHSQMLSPILAERLIERHPQLNLQFCESKESILLDMLRRGEIDLFLGHAQIGSTVYLSGELNTEHLFIYMPDSFLELNAEERAANSPENLYELQPEQLQGLPVIAPTGTQGLYINYMDMVERLHLSSRRVIQTSNQVTALRMVAHGLGFSYSGGAISANASLSMFLTEEEQQHLLYCSVPGLSNTRKFYYAYYPQNPNVSLINEALSALREIIAL